MLYSLLYPKLRNENSAHKAPDPDLEVEAEARSDRSARRAYEVQRDRAAKLEAELKELTDQSRRKDERIASLERQLAAATPAPSRDELYGRLWPRGESLPHPLGLTHPLGPQYAERS